MEDYNKKEELKYMLINELEDLGDYLNINQMANNIKNHDETDIRNLINNGILSARKKRGKFIVKLEDFAEYYAEIFDDIPDNGVDHDYYFSDNEEEYVLNKLTI